MSEVNDKIADLIAELTAEARANARRRFELSLAGARRELKTMADLCDQMSLAIESISARLDGLPVDDPGADNAGDLADDLPDADGADTPTRVLRMEIASGVAVRAALASVPPPTEAAQVPKDAPAWLAPALEATRSTKAQMMLRKLAAEGELALSGVIYAFSPALKESYALNLMSDLRKALSAAQCDLVKAPDGVFTVANKA